MFVQNTSHSMKNSARYYQKGTLLTTQNTCYFCQVIMKHEFSPQIFEKYSNIGFMNIHPVGGQVVPCGQTRHDKAIL